MSESALTQKPAAPTRNQFGTFGGVFTPCILTILGVIMFMRANFVIGEAGILGAGMILVMSMSITLLTALSTSAIATNMEVRGGGAYYLISRVLGADSGGAIGIVLFIAQGVSVPFYVLGFTEALTQSLPVLKPHFGEVAFATAALLFIVTYVGASWAIKIQFLIMAVLGVAIASFMIGGLQSFSPAQFAENWTSHYTPLDISRPEQGAYSFWILFAIYFPAVTGIMAGINMSGDLKDPTKSIPWGTLAAIAVGFTIYLAQILVYGGAYDYETLIDRPYLVLANNAVIGAGYLVAAGMFCATLSSAIGSFMCAPRVLQAVGRDRILPPLRPFAQGSKKGDEPRRAVLLTALLTFIVLGWAIYGAEGTALDIVAGTITECFLYAYGTVNAAAFIEAAGKNPSFRPRFKFFHWSTALAGTVGCVAVAVIINPLQAVIAFTLIAALFWSIRRRELRATFGDARRGYLYQTVRNNLLRLASMEETPKNWRPTCVVFSGNPESRSMLTSYALWFEAHRGIVFLVNILEGTFEEYGPRRGAALTQLRKFCQERRLRAFPVVVVDQDLTHGMQTVLQSVGLGAVRPNVAVFGWPDKLDHLRQTFQVFRMANEIGMNLVVINAGTRAPREKRRQVDIWWRGMKNGALMILLAHLLTRNWDWQGARVRLIRTVSKEEARESTLEDLRELIEAARVQADPVVVVRNDPFAAVLSDISRDSDCVFLGFDMPQPEEEGDWHARASNVFLEEPTTILISSVGGEGLMA